MNDMLFYQSIFYANLIHDVSNFVCLFYFINKTIQLMTKNYLLLKLAPLKILQFNFLQINT